MHSSRKKHVYQDYGITLTELIFSYFREKKAPEVLPRRPRSLRLQRIDPDGAPLPPLPDPEPESRHVSWVKKTKKIKKRGDATRGSLKLVGKYVGPPTKVCPELVLMLVRG